MSTLYRFFQLTVPNGCKVYFGEIGVVNSQVTNTKKPIIFVVNHPSSLMDPIVSGSFIDKPLYFLGRADVFKNNIISYVLRKAHMRPIYRSIDGLNSISKNEEVFNECYQLLEKGKSILIYAEGFTDEEFVRRLKNIKKGAARIAIGAEERNDFQLDLRIIPVGINYTNPKDLGGDLLIRYAEPITVNPFKSNEEKTAEIQRLTERIQSSLIDEIVHVERLDEADQFENILKLFENSIAYDSTLGAQKLQERWLLSKHIESSINKIESSEREVLFGEVNAFWEKLNPEGSEYYIIQLLNEKKIWSTSELAELTIGFPIALIGFLSNLPLMLILIFLPQKLTKRPTFYPGMKIVLGTLVGPLLLLISGFIIAHYSTRNFVPLMFLFLGAMTFVYAVRYWKIIRRFRLKLKAQRCFNMTKSQNIQKHYHSLVDRIPNNH